MLLPSKKYIMSTGIVVVTALIALFQYQGTDSDNHAAFSKEPIGLSPKGAGYFYSAKRVNLNKEVLPQPAITEAVARKRRFFSAQQAKNVAMEQWQSIGPFDVGGRTRALTFKPDNPDIMFAAGVSGGVFKSEDAGASWRPVTDDIENLAVVTLAIPIDFPDMIFAGTGEGQYVGRPITRSRGVEGNGIFVSDDAGASWSAIALTLDNPDFRFVNRIRVGQSSHILAATGSGIWRSTDLGTSWQNVLDQRDRVGGCLEIEVKPDEQNVIMASCGSFQASAVFRSIDGGDTWQEVLADEDQGRTLIAFAPSQPDTVYMLAAQNELGAIPHALKGLYRSDDGGENFRLVTDLNSPNLISRLLLSMPLTAFNCPANEFDQQRIFGQGWFSSLLTIDPIDHERLWVGALDLMRSDDGGETFGIASYWWANPQFGGTTTPSYVHADHHLVVFHPNYDGVTETRMFNANDGGLFVTSNPNATTSQAACDPLSSDIEWRNTNNDYAVNQFYHGDVSPDGSIVIGGMQDNGTYMSVNGEAWQPIGGGDGAYVAFDPTDSRQVYISSQFANINRLNLDDLTTTDVNATITERAPFITPYLVDPNDGERLFLSASSLWRTDNRGQQWQPISTANYDNVVLDWLSAIAVQPNDSNYVLAGSSDGVVYRHDAALNADATYEMAREKVSDGFISSIHYHPFDAQVAFATVSTFGEPHVLYSNNNGVSWQNIDSLGDNGFPDIPAHDVIKAPEDESTLYVASDLGVYVSRDLGQTWQPFGAGFPNTPVEKLVRVRQNRQTTLFAFTYGRGAFKLTLSDDENIAPQFVGESVSIDLNEGEALAVTLADLFIDRNLDTLTYSASGLPSGLVLGDGAELSGSVDTAGSYSFELTATDGELSANTTVSVQINEVVAPPIPPVDPPPSSSGGSLGYWLLILCGGFAIGRRVK